jgi:hypothetical protein
LYSFNPSASVIFPTCPFHACTGLYCPGCGTLRALHQLLHGNFAGALAFNPLLISSLPAIGFLLLFPKYSYRPWVAYLACAIVVAFGILRNIPCWPFAMLAPGGFANP